MSGAAIDVAAAVIERDGRILLSRRPDAAHQGGKWEFPGGKLEAGETAEQALKRELEEELGITPTRFRPLITIAHDYPDKSVVLHVFRVTDWAGTPQGREGQAIRQVAKSELAALTFPDANLPILKAVSLPETCVITPPAFDSRDRFHPALQRNLQRHDLLILRLPALGHDHYLRVARRAIPLAEASDCRLLLTCSVEKAQAIGASGAHLNSRALMSRAAPIQRDDGFLISAACHNPAELEQAQRIGADFALLSPVRPTGSHPGAPPLGWERFSQLVRPAKIPVYALGGMDPAQRADAFAHGAQGVAGITAFWEQQFPPNPQY